MNEAVMDLAKAHLHISLHNSVALLNRVFRGQRNYPVHLCFNLRGTPIIMKQC